MQSALLLKPGTLWAKAIERTERARRGGALQPLSSEYEFVEQDGIDFIVRILVNLARKDEAKNKEGEKTVPVGEEYNPFLPYDPNLFVAEVSDTHVCLLNKFNVVDYHLLIVTRQFEDQENLLTVEDFAALWACMIDFDGLAFYNAGKIAGASQRHKHLQLIPLPLAPEGPEIPIEPALSAVHWQGPIGTTPRFPFVHAVARLDGRRAGSRLEAAKAMLECYHGLLQATGLQDRGNRQSGPYNLLATRRWMLLAPRSRERFQTISVNSLGFAGALLVRNRQEMQIVKDHGPMTVLEGVALSRSFK